MSELLLTKLNDAQIEKFDSAGHLASSRFMNPYIGSLRMSVCKAICKEVADNPEIKHAIADGALYNITADPPVKVFDLFDLLPAFETAFKEELAESLVREEAIRAELAERDRKLAQA